MPVGSILIKVLNLKFKIPNKLQITMNQKHYRPSGFFVCFIIRAYLLVGFWIL